MNNRRVNRDSKTRQVSELDSKLQYIIDNNPRGVVKVLHEAGYPSPQNHEQLYSRVVKYLRDDGPEAFEALLHIHPDRELIIDHANNNGHIKLLTERQRQRQPVHYDHFTGPAAENIDYESKPQLPANAIVSKPVDLNPGFRNFMVFVVIIIIFHLIYKY